MSLNEFQQKVLSATNAGEGMLARLRNNDHLARVMVPRSPEAQAFRHEIGGLDHTLDVVREIGKGNLSRANELVEELRRQVGESSRGVAKDALPMLLGCGIIEEMFEGGVRAPERDIDDLLEELIERQRKANDRYNELQWGDYEPNV